MIKIIEYVIDRISFFTNHHKLHLFCIVLCLILVFIKKNRARVIWSQFYFLYIYRIYLFLYLHTFSPQIVTTCFNFFRPKYRLFIYTFFFLNY